MKKPLVSIIIPLFNQSKFVGEAIQSAIDQTYKGHEIIVVDDGSTDDSREIIAAFDNHVRYIWQENQGLAGARNTGILAAKGELIGLLDADDQWLPEYLEKMIALADNHSEAVVFYCCAQSMDENGRNLPEIFGGPPRSPEELYSTLLRANFLIPSTILMHRSAVISADLFDQSLRSCEDWDLWLRILQTKDIIGTSECLVRYRLHSSSLSTNPVGMQQAIRSVIEEHFGLDDGIPQTWSPEKRRAFGGVYRYYALTSAQRQKDWQAAGKYLRQALLADPSLSEDLDLFYDLAHTGQPVGYRGTPHDLDFESNAEHVRKLLNNVFSSNASLDLKRIRQITYASANYAFGLVAYQVGKYRDARKHLFSAIKFNIDLIWDIRAIKTLLKSSLGESVLSILRNLRGLAYDRGRN